MPSEYRSKPAKIMAERVTDDNLQRVAAWCGGVIALQPEVGVVVPTINGPATAAVGHYVIEGPNDFYPCDPDTFEARWEFNNGALADG